MSQWWLRKAALSTFSVVLMFASISAMAENRCESRIRNAEHHLQQAIRKMGSTAGKLRSVVQNWNMHGQAVIARRSRTTAAVKS